MTTKERINEIFNRFNVALTAKESEKTELEMTAKLDNGTTIYTDADSWSEGVDVFIVNDEGERIPLPEGEYTLADGSVFTIGQGGVMAVAPDSKSAEGEGGEGAGPASSAASPPKGGTAPSKGKTPPKKGKKSAQDKLAEEEVEDKKEEEKDEKEELTEEYIVELINKIIDDREKEDDKELEEVVEEEEKEEDEVAVLKSQIEELSATITELRTEAASEGVKRQTPSTKVVEPVDLKSLTTEERIKVLFNQFNKA